MRRATPGRDRHAAFHAPPRASGAPHPRPHVVVVGGGIAGLAAATVLAERGAQVTLLEREASLGGRVRSWPVDVPVDVPVHLGGTTMSRGFHAFFRQYYNLRAILRRADPQLERLLPLADYPLVHADGYRDSFAGLPRTPPWSIAAFAARSPSFPAAQLARVDLRAALGLLRVAYPASFDAYDGRSATDVLDALRFPPAARHLALEVFARSFFADPATFSGAELVAMFHSYFLGSAEGLLFDVPDGDYDRVLWRPLGEHLRRLGVDVRTGVEVGALRPGPRSVSVRTSADSRELSADAVVVAATLGGAQRLLADSPGIGSSAWRAAVARHPHSPRFVVWRRWLDAPVRAGSPPFLGTAGFAELDNVSCVHLFEAEAAEWSRATGGSVVELHAYALPDDADDGRLRRSLLAQLHRLHPELARASVVHEEWIAARDCPLVTPEPWGRRPGIDSGADRVVAAGDWVRVDLPVALMERAATTGIMAADLLLSRFGRVGQGVWTVPLAGVLRPAARRRRGARPGPTG